MNTDAKKPKYDTQPSGLEKWVDESVTKLPQLPEGFRTWLADNAWWLALIGGLLSLWGAWTAWTFMQTIGQWNIALDEMSRLYGGPAVATVNAWGYLPLISGVVAAILYLSAVPKLKVHQKAGWNLLLYGTYVHVIVSLLLVFGSYYGLSGLVGALIGTAISWYILFQIRSKFFH